MSTERPMTRREALRLTVLFGAAASAPAMLAVGCGKKELSCTDTAGLAPADANLRGQLGYVDKSTEAEKNCANCQFYKPAAPDACGGCNLMKGPINPKGYCKSWAKKQG